MSENPKITEIIDELEGIDEVEGTKFVSLLLVKQIAHLEEEHRFEEAAELWLRNDKALAGLSILPKVFQTFDFAMLLISLSKEPSEQAQYHKWLGANGLLILTDEQLLPEFEKMIESNEIFFNLMKEYISADISSFTDKAMVYASPVVFTKMVAIILILKLKNAHINNRKLVKLKVRALSALREVRVKQAIQFYQEAPGFYIYDSLKTYI